MSDSPAGLSYSCQRGLYPNTRRQFHGKNDQHQKHRDHLLCERSLGRPSSQAHSQIWDLGGQREFVSMLPLVSNDASAILFMFDLTRKTTLNSVKEWYRQARGFNKVGMGMPYQRRADSPDRDTHLDRYQIRLVYGDGARGTGRDHKTGQTILESDARSVGERCAGRLVLMPRSSARRRTRSTCKRSSKSCWPKCSTSR